MQVLRQTIREDFAPVRFARGFRRHVGLRLSHVLIAAALLAAMYFATERYSDEDGYRPPASGTIERPSER